MSDAGHVTIPIVILPVARPTCREQVLVTEGNRFHFARCGALATWQFDGGLHPAYCLKHKARHVYRLMFAIAADTGLPRAEAFQLARGHFIEVKAT